MSKIYVITRGHYSEYEVIGATTDKDRAEQLQKMHSNSMSAANIEEFEDGECTDWYTPRQYWRVWLNENLDEFSFDQYWDEPDDEDHPLVRIHSREEGKWLYEVERIIAEDRNHALKIAFDRLAAYASMEKMR